ncbi:MAG TPA: hypothetical protein PKX06_15250, partial [Phenylobacterium sp.]|nr:hypothetical protein [Phenylobacterium sp.]
MILPHHFGKGARSQLFGQRCAGRRHRFIGNKQIGHGCLSGHWRFGASAQLLYQASIVPDSLMVSGLP